MVGGAVRSERNRLALVPGVGESAHGHPGGGVASPSFRSWLRAGFPRPPITICGSHSSSSQSSLPISTWPGIRAGANTEAAPAGVVSDPVPSLITHSRPDPGGQAAPVHRPRRARRGGRGLTAPRPTAWKRDTRCTPYAAWSTRRCRSQPEASPGKPDGPALARQARPRYGRLSLTAARIVRSHERVR